MPTINKVDIEDYSVLKEPVDNDDGKFADVINNERIKIEAVPPQSRSQKIKEKYLSTNGAMGTPMGV